MRGRLRHFVGAGWVTALAACSGGDGNGGSTAVQGVPLDDIPAMYAEGLCALVERCVGPDYLALAFPNQDCRDRTRKEYEQTKFSIVRAQVESGGIAYDPASAEACAEALAAQSCDSEISDAACDAVFEGNVATGSQCEVDEQCQGDDYCVFDGACPGTCTAKKGGGEACDSDDECADGLACWLTGEPAMPVCTEVARQDETCEGTNGPPCGGLMYCDRPDLTSAGNCRPLSETMNGEVAEACSLEGQQLCKPGLVCVIGLSPAVIFQSCRERQTAPGGPCRLAYPTDCPDGEYCPLTFDQVGMGIAEANCRPLPVAGEPCTTDAEGSGQCAAGLRCDGTTCVEPKNLGESCTSREACRSDYCVSGQCVASAYCD